MTGFTFEDNGDGTFSFTVGDVGTGPCAYAHSDTLVGTGDLATGFTGAVSSGPWTVNADGMFSVTGLTFTFPPSSGLGLGGNYAITGDANGIMARTVWALKSYLFAFSPSCKGYAVQVWGLSGQDLTVLVRRVRRAT